MQNFIIKALQNYQKVNKNLPNNIYVYRDGVGGPTIENLCKEYEPKMFV